MTADRLHGFGIRIDFLLHLTWELNLWEWETWEVVQFLVSPPRSSTTAAASPSCRWCGASRPATVCVALLGCEGRPGGGGAGADTRRVVWIDVSRCGSGRQRRGPGFSRRDCSIAGGDSCARGAVEEVDGGRHAGGSKGRCLPGKRWVHRSQGAGAIPALVPGGDLRGDPGWEGPPLPRRDGGVGGRAGRRWFWRAMRAGEEKAARAC